MQKPSKYTIGSESISDYLSDLENRWGVRMVFHVKHDPDPYRDGGLLLELEIEHPIHKAEIPWASPLIRYQRACDASMFLFVLWDMLYQFDQEIERCGRT